MNNKTRLVLKGYLALSPQEQAELIRELNRTIDLSQIEKSTKSRRISMELGPVSGGCPCCGR